MDSKEVGAWIGVISPVVIGVGAGAWKILGPIYERWISQKRVEATSAWDTLTRDNAAKATRILDLETQLKAKDERIEELTQQVVEILEEKADLAGEFRSLLDALRALRKSQPPESGVTSERSPPSVTETRSSLKLPRPPARR